MSRMSSLSFFPTGGVGGNSQTVISWRKRKRGRRGKEAGNSQSLSPFAPLVWEQAAVLLPFWTELCRSPLMGRQKNGESKSKQSHLFKWATTSQWQRGFLIHSFPFFSLASVDSLSTQGKIKITFALAQRDETDWCAWSVQPPPMLSDCSGPCKIVINMPEKEFKGRSMPWTCTHPKGRSWRYGPF